MTLRNTMTEFIARHALVRPALAVPDERGGALHGAHGLRHLGRTLDADRGNAVLIVTGLSPDARMTANAGNRTGLVGSDGRPGKPIDSGRWFVICVNARQLQGLDRPASIDPGGRPYRLDFPNCRSRTAPMRRRGGARAGHRTPRLRHRQLDGRMMSLALLATASRHCGSHVNISGAARACRSPSRSARCSARAIRLDPKWNHGDYDDALIPELACAWRASWASSPPLGAGVGRSLRPVRLEDERRGRRSVRLRVQVESLEGHARASCAASTRTATSTSRRWTGNDPRRRPRRRRHARAGLAAIRRRRRWPSACGTDILFPLQQQEQIAEGGRRRLEWRHFLPLAAAGPRCLLVDRALRPAVRFLDALRPSAHALKA